MMRALLQVVLNGVAVLVAAYLVPGISYTGSLLSLLLVGLVIGLINLIVKPIVTVLSLPLIVVTLGLFYLVINGLMLWLAALLLPHTLQVSGCGAAILGGLVIALVNWLVRAFTKES
ncbi:MAG TPA: phage holin family protein [Thermoanaerobaculia bacterium]|jgi:putative membrane protein